MVNATPRPSHDDVAVIKVWKLLLRVTPRVLALCIYIFHDSNKRFMVVAVLVVSRTFIHPSWCSTVDGTSYIVACKLIMCIKRVDMGRIGDGEPNAH